MPKKRTTVKKKAPSKKQIENQLIDNFVQLQKVMANMASRFDNLSDNINKLLQLFEIAAKSFIKKQEVGGPGDADMLKKVDTLLEQNKTIAGGLTLIEEKIRHRIGEGPASLPSVTHAHGEEELHGLYPTGEGGKPRPKGFPEL